MTLNQVIQQMVSLAKSHKQIHHVYFADIVEWLSNGTVKYPAMFFDLTGARISGTEKQTLYSFEIWFCDLTNVSGNARGNELEVLSDMTSVAEDYAAMLKWEGFGWAVGEDHPLEYFREQFTDWVAAVRMRIDIGVHYPTDRCQVPTTYTFGEEQKYGLYMLTESGEFMLSEEGTRIQTESE